MNHMRRLKLAQRVVQRFVVSNIHSCKNDFPVIDQLLESVSEPDFHLVRVIGTAGNHDLIDLIIVMRDQIVNRYRANATSPTCDKNSCHCNDSVIIAS